MRMKRKTTKNIYPRIAKRMSLCFDFQRKEDLEYFLGILFLGGITLLKEDDAQVDNIEYFMFRPVIYKYLKKNKIDGALLSLVEQGMEIEDVKSLVPDALPTTLDDMAKALIAVLKQKTDYKEVIWTIENDEI